MIDITKLKLKLNQTLGAEKFILLAQTEKTVYDDGKPTEKKQVVATITTPESLFEKIDVKLDGAGASITNDELKDRVENLDFVYVTFEDDEVKIYKDFSTNSNKISAKAKSIKPYLDDDMIIE